jgi:hypothetical protein
VLTNDGNAILREIDVTHPAAKVRRVKRALKTFRCVDQKDYKFQKKK